MVRGEHDKFVRVPEVIVRGLWKCSVSDEMAGREAEEEASSVFIEYKTVCIEYEKC
jgi:hypothetical protein